MPEPSESLPIFLFNAGFDVWIDGNRGSIYQRGHKDASIIPEKYWNFTMNEMGVEDQKAQIDYILKAS